MPHFNHVTTKSMCMIWMGQKPDQICTFNIDNLLLVLPTGLCGNFNKIMVDDFTGISGLVEGTAAAFANSWKTSASCSDITLTFGHPCSLSFNKGTHFTASLTSKLQKFLFHNCFVLHLHQRTMPSSGAPSSQMPAGCFLSVTLLSTQRNTKM